MTAGSAGRAPIVDVHTHYLPAALVAALERRADLPRISTVDGRRMIQYGEGSGHPVLPSMGDVGARLRDMDADGIDRAVLSVTVPGVDWFPPADGIAVARDVNDELVAQAAANPDRLAGLAVLAMQEPEAAAEELRRALGLGLCGAMIYSNVAGRRLDEPAFDVVFDTAAELGAPITIHPTYPLSARSMDAYALIPTLGFLVDTTTATLRLVLGGLYERHPDFKLILPHGGSLIPWLAGRIDIEAANAPGGRGALSVAPSEQLRLLYTDTVCGSESTLRQVIGFLGADRVMFGTDYPFWAAEHTLATLAAAELEDASARAIGSATAERVFGLSSPSSHGGTT